jgi:hypothetical protein
MTAKTVAQRQEALRARRALEGLAEVRGIYWPTDLHPQLKESAMRLLKRIQKPKKQAPS